MKHLLSIQELDSETILEIVRRSAEMKNNRRSNPQGPLAGQIWALIFLKSSTRTRVSFEVGIRELGGSVMFLASDEIQLGRGEPIEDTARVMGRMLHGAVIRTFDQRDVDIFAAASGISTINALTDEEHPCQILSDLFTLAESGKDLRKLKIAFVGDGDCNVAHSWVWAAHKLRFDLRIAAPQKFLPSPRLLEAAGDCVSLYKDPTAAIQDADAIYTDVWVSMGKEDESAFRLAQFSGYQVDEQMVAHAPAALVMHCLPAYRGKEISAGVFEAHAETIFRQAENRLHTQKAILTLIASHSA